MVKYVTVNLSIYFSAIYGLVNMFKYISTWANYDYKRWYEEENYLYTS